MRELTHGRTIIRSRRISESGGRVATYHEPMNAKLPATAALWIAFALPLSAAAQTVVTTSGTVQGVSGGGVDKFLGIPYAQPPIGSLRWARPVPFPPSPTTIDGTTAKAACTQVLNTTSANDCRDNSSQTNGTLVGSEDCLTLSVWRPTAAAAHGPRPVMVWIHGGALVTGCAKDGLSEGTDLALQGTSSGGDGQIVVAVQYRLGPMGFFALPELQSEDAHGSVGNYGLLDDMLALQWVHDNIAAFGGDPNDVTTFGESAGGFSTYILEASPPAQGLFNRNISESGLYGQALPLQPGVGAPSSDFGPTATAFPRGIALANDSSLGCTDPGTRLSCMRGKTAAQIFSAYTAQSGSGSSSLTASSPAIDGYVLSEQPSQMILEGDVAPRPLLVGSNANELTVFTLTSPVLNTAADYENAVRAALGTTAGNIVLGVYPASAFPTPIAAYRRVFEDILFVCPTFTSGKLLHDVGGESHVYHFEYAPSSFLGSFHSAELYYVFGNVSRLTSIGVTPDAGDTLLSDAMQTAWTSFAKNGAPVATPPWPPFDPGAGDLAANGGVYVWNLDPNNVLINQFTASQNLRDGRCAQLASLSGTLNGDFDAFTNDVDNCPFTTNSDQADSGGVAGGGPDGIGNACQCGDTSDDGAVDATDVTVLRNALAGIAPLGKHGEAKCRVESQSPGCDVVDLTVLRRRLATPALPPGISQSCAAANPA
jgi:para-nitrobenzyl esterase